MPALHLVLFYFTLYVTFGYSISLIRDPARGSSQLYLHVAWTSTFKQFFQKWLIPVFAHSDSVGSHPSYIAPWYLTFRFSLWFILFLGEFSKMAAVYLHRPPYPPRGESRSPCRSLGEGGGVAWAKRRMTFETTRKWWSFFVPVLGWLELCQTFKNSPMFSNVKKERIWIQRRSAKSGDRRNFTMSIQELLLKFKEILK